MIDYHESTVPRDLYLCAFIRIATEIKIILHVGRTAADIPNTEVRISMIENVKVNGNA